MRIHISSFVLALIALPLMAVASTSEDVLASILTRQGVTEAKSIDCSTITDTEAESYGQAFFTEQIDSSGPEYRAIEAGFPPEVLKSIYRGMGLQSLGCIGAGGVASDTPMGFPQTLSTDGGPSAPAPVPAAPLRAMGHRGSGHFGYIAIWTTIMWMFSALGFAIFMVWVTSSKFRFQFRKMAEGEFDNNDKAMSILKERFARGEMKKDEFESARKEILR